MFNPGNFGVWQVLIILLIVLVLFGASKLPQIGRGFGQAISEFRTSVKKKEDDDDTSSVAAGEPDKDKVDPKNA